MNSKNSIFDSLDPYTGYPKDCKLFKTEMKKIREKLLADPRYKESIAKIGKMVRRLLD